MKIRMGFVSNSSSGSFIVEVETVQVLERMFKNNPGFGENEVEGEGMSECIEYLNLISSGEYADISIEERDRKIAEVKAAKGKLYLIYGDRSIQNAVYDTYGLKVIHADSF